MELHLVHEEIDNPNTKLVIGIFLDIAPDNQVGGTDQSLLRQAFRPLAQANTASVPLGEEREIGSIDMPAGSSLFQELLPPGSTSDLPVGQPRFTGYVGSLTTPPCSDNVIWYVSAIPRYVTAFEVDSFKLHFPMNARALQTLRPLRFGTFGYYRFGGLN